MTRRSSRPILGRRMLTLKDIHVSYGQAPALHGVSLEVPEGQIVTILGSTGRGRAPLSGRWRGCCRCWRVPSCLQAGR